MSAGLDRAQSAGSATDAARIQSRECRCVFVRSSGCRVTTKRKGAHLFPETGARARSGLFPACARLPSWISFPLALNYNSSTSIYLEGQPLTRKQQAAARHSASRLSPDYFRTDGDSHFAAATFHRPGRKAKEYRVAIVNETLRAASFSRARIRSANVSTFSGADKPFWEIIGVCRRWQIQQLGEEPKAALFRPHCATTAFARVNLVARTKGDPQTVLAAMQPRAAANSIRRCLSTT